MKETQTQLANSEGGMPISMALAKESAALKLQAMELKKQNETLSHQVVALTTEVSGLRELVARVVLLNLIESVVERAP